MAQGHVKPTHAESMQWMADGMATLLGKDPDELKRDVNRVARERGDKTMPYPEVEA